MGESINGINNSSKDFVSKTDPKKTNKAATTNIDAAAQAHQESPLPLRDTAAKFAQPQNQASPAEST